MDRSLIESRNEENEKLFQFRLEQNTNTPDNYKPLKPVYSTTTSYSYLNSFLVGLKLDNWYKYSSDCLDSLISTIDDKDYFQRNLTLYSGAGENLLHPILNLTGLIGSNLADSLPLCYQFGSNVVSVEKTRYNSFSGWGDLILAFVFN